jgi:hypothetical protein
VLKEKEEKAFGEYRTRRLVLEAELRPVVVRNYREEMAAVPGRVAETGPGYEAPVQPATPARPRFGATQAPGAAAQPDLFGALADASESNSGFMGVAQDPDSKSVLMGVPPQGRPAPTDSASTQVDARPQAPQA